MAIVVLLELKPTICLNKFSKKAIFIFVRNNIKNFQSTDSVFMVRIDGFKEARMRGDTDIEHDIGEEVRFTEFVDEFLEDRNGEFRDFIVEFQISAGKISIEGIFRFDFVKELVNKFHNLVLVIIGQSQFIQM